MQSLSERVYIWENKESWPPQSNFHKSSALKIIGSVIDHYPINIRKAGINTGYLSQAVTADTQLKYTAIQLALISAHYCTENSDIKFSELPSLLSNFTNNIIDSTKQKVVCVTNSTITIFADRSIVSILCGKREANQTELNAGSKLQIVTQYSTIIAKSVEMIELAHKPTATGKADMNLVDASLQQFKSVLANKLHSKQVDDTDEWDD